MVRLHAPCCDRLLCNSASLFSISGYVGADRKGCMNPISEEMLSGIANQLRIHSITSTTTAGSGHPTSCCSAAEVVAALFFGHMRYDAKNPKYHNNDRFLLSKGHAAPILYAAWAEAGLFPVTELAK